jgi:hypothetical protein
MNKNTDVDILSAPWAITPGALERIAHLVYQGRDLVADAGDAGAVAVAGSGEDVDLDIRNHIACI